MSLSHFSQALGAKNDHFCASMWNTIFCQLSALDQVQLGLCNRQANVTFWKSSKLWYTRSVFYIPTTRSIRKLRINLFALENESLDQLTHLHVSVSDIDNSEYVKSIVLPPNLTYCFLAPSNCLTRCTLAMSLTFLETKDINVNFINLDNHPNLTVLHMSENTYYAHLTLPPNLRELSTYTAGVIDTFPSSLISAGFSQFDIKDLQRLSPNLTELNLSYISNEDGLRIQRPHENVRSVRLNSFVADGILALMPTLFPKVTNLKIDCRGSQNGPPVFHSVQKLHLDLYDSSIVFNTFGLDAWKSLVDLKLFVTGWTCDPILEIYLPSRLARFAISRSIKSKLHIHIPASLTYASFESSYSMFNISMCPNAKLRTLRTTGNVFANRVKFPDSLHSFHVTLHDDQPLRESWDPLPTCVDFQVFRD